MFCCSCRNAIGQNRRVGFALQKYLVLEIQNDQVRRITSVDLRSPNMLRGIDYIRDPRLNKVINPHSLLPRLNYLILADLGHFPFLLPYLLLTVVFLSLSCSCSYPPF